MRTLGCCCLHLEPGATILPWCFLNVSACLDDWAMYAAKPGTLLGCFTAITPMCTENLNDHDTID